MDQLCVSYDHSLQTWEKSYSFSDDVLNRNPGSDITDLLFGARSELVWNQVVLVDLFKSIWQFNMELQQSKLDLGMIVQTKYSKDFIATFKSVINHLYLNSNLADMFLFQYIDGMEYRYLENDSPNDIMSITQIPRILVMIVNRIKGMIVEPTLLINDQLYELQVGITNTDELIVIDGFDNTHDTKFKLLVYNSNQ